MERDWERVILLSADALRTDHLSYYGYHREASPVLDELVKESTTHKMSEAGCSFNDWGCSE